MNAPDPKMVLAGSIITAVSVLVVKAVAFGVGLGPEDGVALGGLVSLVATVLGVATFLRWLGFV